MKRFLPAVILAATMGSAHAEDQPKSAEQAFGEVFCLVKDLPAAAGMEMIVTPSLADEIAAAWKKNEIIAKAHPDEKPPLGDGIPFQSYPDLTPRCEVGVITGEGVGAVVEIRHLFPDAPGANYSDRLVVGQGWRPGVFGIDDVLYGAEGDKGSLRKALAEAFE
jgi:hypothetical protein